MFILYGMWIPSKEKRTQKEGFLEWILKVSKKTTGNGKRDGLAKKTTSWWSECEEIEVKTASNQPS